MKPGHPWLSLSWVSAGWEWVEVPQGETCLQQAWRQQSSGQMPPLCLKGRETQKLLAHPRQQSAVNRRLWVMAGLPKSSPIRDLSMLGISS